MSGRRRRDDGWDDGRLDAQDDRRDPWADDGIGEWGADADPGDEADRSGKSSGGAAGAYVRNAPPGGKAYAAPDFPSFQAGSGGSGGDRYASGSGYGGQRADGYRDAGQGGSRDGYQGSGYGRSGNGGGRRDAAGYDAAYGGGDSAGGYGRSGNGSGGRGNDSGYGNGSGYGSGSGYAGANGRLGGAGYAPEFTSVDSDEADDDGPADTPRPYGRLSIYTLHDDKTREFDRLAERAAEGVRTAEPDTLVYVIHVVPKAPMQRIIYEIYRDRAAFMSHERQPHIRQFAAERAPCVLATNIIDLRLKYAKVAALGPSPTGSVQGHAQQPNWNQRAAEATPGNDRYSAAAQYASPQYSTAQYTPGQYPSGQSQGAQGSATAAASFTPARDRYDADNSQYPTVGREAYSPAAQYGNSGNADYGAGNSQYDAANSNGYSGTAGYANGGSYSSSGYPSPNGYQGANGYSSDNGYSGGNGYPSANGYSGANGYPNGTGYSNSSGYPNGSYSAANGYPNAGGYSNGAVNGGTGYGAAGGYADSGAGSHPASNGAQYTPRYRELTSGAESAAGAGGYQDNGNRYQDDGRQSARPQSAEWDSRPQGYR
jgi:quinol monooxygenase YgiN